MDNIELDNEIELRMNPEDFSLNSSDIIDIMNQFDINEQELAVAYSRVADKNRAELTDISKEAIDYLRDRGNYYPSFQEFKKVFSDFSDHHHYINEKILKDMYKKELKDVNQLSLFEFKKTIQKEINKIIKEDTFDKDSEKIMKKWGGADEPEEKFSAEEFFGDAGDAAQKDIENEFGEDEFSPFGTFEDPNMLKDLDDIGELDEDLDVGSEKLSMFMSKDANGNRIKINSFVGPSDGGDKRGHVKRFGDDGEGKTTIIVNWEWPIGMKHESPKEMGEIKEYPENLIVQNTKPTETKTEELEESGRGLGSGVKNSGDRNVKQREDHAHSPLTNINESIKTLFENKVTKKELISFIKEEAKKIFVK